MLENLNDHLCVSRYKRKEQDMWICYELSKTHSSSKRQAWKPLTGLLSKPAMQRYLEHIYQSREINDNYEVISQHR